MKPVNNPYIDVVSEAVGKYKLPLMIASSGEPPTDFRAAIQPRPWIALLEDKAFARGPEGFDLSSLQALMEVVNHALVVANSASVDSFRLLSLMPAHLHTGSLIVLTDAAQVEAWVQTLRRLKPSIQILPGMPQDACKARLA